MESQGLEQKPMHGKALGIKEGASVFIQIFTASNLYSGRVCGQDTIANGYDEEGLLVGHGSVCGV